MRCAVRAIPALRPSWSSHRFSPTKLSYSMAISNKLRDMDIDLVILAGYNMPLGVISTQFRKRIIGVYPRSSRRSSTATMPPTNAPRSNAAAA